MTGRIMTGFATLAGIAGFGWLALFQAMLAAGLPLGRLAWGGAHTVLPKRLRLASGISALVALAALWTVAQAGGGIAPVLPGGWITLILSSLAALFGLSLLANLFGARGAERLHGVPLALVCAGSCLILALA